MAANPPTCAKPPLSSCSHAAAPLYPQNMPEEVALQTWYDYLPAKPHVLYNKSKSAICSKHSPAFRKYSHTQLNHINSRGSLAYDIDRSVNVYEMCCDLNLPLPNFYIQNKDNGKAHLLYILQTPVHLNPNSSTRPIKWCAAIERAYTEKLGADMQYTGYMSKNALHEQYRVKVLTNQAYSLSALWQPVSDVSFDCRRPVADSGIGRNVYIFNALRRWAYSLKKRNDIFHSEQEFVEIVKNYADALNDQPEKPLSPNELRHIAKSVGTWVYRKYDGTMSGKGTMSDEEFSALQSKRAKRGVELADTGIALSMSERGKLGGKNSFRSIDPTSERTRQPWRSMGISRATYYRRKNKSK